MTKLPLSYQSPDKGKCCFAIQCWRHQHTKLFLQRLSIWNEAHWIWFVYNYIWWFNFDALAQGNAYKHTKEPINYRGSIWDRTHYPWLRQHCQLTVVQHIRFMPLVHYDGTTFCSMPLFEILRGVSIKRCCLTSIGIPIIKIRRSHDRLIFIMEIPKPGKIIIT